MATALAVISGISAAFGLLKALAPLSSQLGLSSFTDIFGSSGDAFGSISEIFGSSF